MFGELITFYFESHMKHITAALRRQSAGFFCVTESGIYKGRRDLKGKFSEQIGAFHQCFTRKVALQLSAASFEVKRQTQRACIAVCGSAVHSSP
jgi:hypothetical protein